MSYLALYRKYRPVNFDEVVGQSFVVKTLENAIVNNKLSHAYLFSGPRGTGKTSIAKLIAKVINCEKLNGYTPCEECSSCLAISDKTNPDIFEIDAASNNGVDEIREIRDKVNLVPTLSKYKIYIIDEVHMLSTGAFNALLKTLEEPPSHVIFILATTEYYKVPETIISRCQSFEFERLGITDIVNKLSYISNSEKINVDKKVLELIAQYSDGGLRDAINMLDKLASAGKKIKVEDFYEIKGLVNNDDILDITSDIIQSNVDKVFEKLELLINKGKNVTLLAEELLIHFKDIIIKNAIDNIPLGFDVNNLYEIVENLNKTINSMKKSSYPKIILEVNLLKIMKMFNFDNNIVIEQIIDSSEKEQKDNNKMKIDKTNKEENLKDEIVENKAVIEEVEQSKEEILKETNDEIIDNEKIKEKNRQIRINNTFASANKEILSDLKIRWINFSDYLHNKEFANVVSYLLDGTLRVASDKYIIVSVRYDSILENAQKNIDKIETLFNIVCGKNCKIAFILDDEWKSLRDSYVKNKNNGITYEIKTELELIKESNINKDDLSEAVSEAISLFGNDLVEIN